MKRYLYLLLAWLCCNLPAHAQERPDSLLSERQLAWDGTPGKPVFHPKQLIFPAVAITLGSVGAATGFGKKVNREIRDALRYRDHKIKADDYVQYLPVVSVYGLSLLGAPAKHDYLERTVITATAYATMGILVNGVKYVAKVRRPDGSSRNSFPSGHTATAFMGAELVRQEYGVWYGTAAYAVATAIGVSRIYNDRHWATDVLAGAGFGVLSAKVAYWLFPSMQRWFGMDKRKKRAALSAMPFYSGDGGGLALNWQF